MELIVPVKWTRRLSAVLGAPAVVLPLIVSVFGAGWWLRSLRHKAAMNASSVRLTVAERQNAELSTKLDAANAEIDSLIQQLQTGIAIDQMRITAGAARRLLNDARAANAAVSATLRSDAPARATSYPKHVNPVA
jgi:hypothetical protein